jgi:hypothetical protein
MTFAENTEWMALCRYCGRVLGGVIEETDGTWTAIPGRTKPTGMAPPPEHNLASMVEASDRLKSFHAGAYRRGPNGCVPREWGV